MGLDEADQENGGQAGRVAAAKGLNTALPAASVDGRQRRRSLGVTELAVVLVGGVRRAALHQSNSPGLL